LAQPDQLLPDNRRQGNQALIFAAWQHRMCQLCAFSAFRSDLMRLNGHQLSLLSGSAQASLM
jgi:hypothetical protein